MELDSYQKDLKGVEVLLNVIASDDRMTAHDDEAYAPFLPEVQTSSRVRAYLEGGIRGLSKRKLERLARLAYEENPRGWAELNGLAHHLSFPQDIELFTMSLQATDDVRLLACTHNDMGRAYASHHRIRWTSNLYDPSQRDLSLITQSDESFKRVRLDVMPLSMTEDMILTWMDQTLFEAYQVIRPTIRDFKPRFSSEEQLLLDNRVESAAEYLRRARSYGQIGILLASRLKMGRRVGEFKRMVAYYSQCIDNGPGWHQRFLQMDPDVLEKCLEHNRASEARARDKN